MSRRFVVMPDQDAVATAAAARLAVRLLDTLTVRDEAHVALTGGGLGTATLAALAAQPAAVVVDWSRVHLWWGDERFLPPGDPERNETQARQVWLDGLAASSAIPEGNIHAMPAAGGDGVSDAPTAASQYGEALRRAVPPGAHPSLPVLDVLLLGVGPDGHVASLFPGHPALEDHASACVPVFDSPKPPPVRLSLSLPVLRNARAVWLLASGAGKAAAVGDAVRQTGPVVLPAGRVEGTEETLWLLDVEAAATLPSVGTPRTLW